jgi:hypothetical protein
VGYQTARAIYFEVPGCTQHPLQLSSIEILFTVVTSQFPNDVVCVRVDVRSNHPLSVALGFELLLCASTERISSGFSSKTSLKRGGVFVFVNGPTILISDRQLFLSKASSTQLSLQFPFSSDIAGLCASRDFGGAPALP